MTTAALLLACAGAFIPFAVIVGAGMLLASRLAGLPPATAVAAGLGSLGCVCLLVLWGTYFAAPAGVAIALGLSGAAVLVLVYFRAWRSIRTWLPVLLVTVGALVLTVGMVGPTFGDGVFREVATRFLPWSLPEDNQIPGFLATWFARPERGEFLIGDWLPSDRPPLQAGAILLIRALAPLWPGNPDIEVIDIGASMAIQLAWVPAVVSLCAAVGFGARSALMAAAFSAVVPVTIINTAYTWPKLLSAAFVIVALSALVTALRERVLAGPTLAVAAACSALALLAHGAAAFTLPAVLALAFVLLARMRDWGVRLKWAAASAAAVALLYGPWLLFQRFVAPPGDRLLKWHLAGVVPINDRSFLADLVMQYREVGWSGALASRLSNIGHAFDVNLLQGLDLWNEGALSRRLTAEFYQTPVALALGVVPVLLLVATATVRKIRGQNTGANTRWALLIVGLAVGCVGLWSLAMFHPDGAIVHQGSHAWMLVLLAVPFAWLFGRVPSAALTLAVCQLALTLVLLARATADPARGANLAVVSVALMLFIVAILLARAGVARHERGVNAAAAGAAAPAAHSGPAAQGLDRYDVG